MLFTGLDEECIVNFQARNYITFMLKSEVKAAKEVFYKEAINLLATYRNEVSTSEISTQFVVPQTLNNYVLYLQCIFTM